MSLTCTLGNMLWSSIGPSHDKQSASWLYFTSYYRARFLSIFLATYLLLLSSYEQAQFQAASDQSQTGTFYHIKSQTALL